MKFVDTWFWPEGELHMLEWIADPKNRRVINGRPAYQGKKQLIALDHCTMDRRRVMVDAGAHIGLWSYNFAHWFEKIEAFEPVADHRECFEKNVMAVAEKITLHPFALGEREDMVSIRVNPTSTGDSWVKGKGEVPMRSIDSFAFENVDLIKIDAEGYEEFIVRGMLDTLERCGPVVVVEQKRDMATKFGLKPLGAVKLLIEHGYKTVAEIGGDFVMRTLR